MVRVPEIQNGVSLRAGGGARIQINASGSAFGADVGRGMQGLAQGMNQAAQALDHVKQFDDELRARDADMAAANELRELQYGENGFLTLQGRNAVEQREAYDRAAQEIIQRHGEGLTGRAASAYNVASQSRMSNFQQSSIQHQASSRAQWNTETSNAILDTAAETAVANYANPDAVNFEIARGQVELREQAQLQGWDQATLANKEAQYISDVRTNVVTRLLAEDPVAASAYYEANKDQFTGPQQFQIEDGLRVPLMNARVQSNTAAFFGPTGAPISHTSRSGNSAHPASIIGTESGGDFTAQNDAVGSSGREGHFGRIQFGQDRFDEAVAAGAVPAGMTLQEFLQNPAVQIEAENWHWADINRYIEQNNLTRFIGQTIDGVEVTIDGIRAMAHLGGNGGAAQFLRTGGKYNPADAYGTSLRDYLKTHAGTTVATGNTGPLADYQSLEAYLSTIENPVEREATRNSITARLNAESQAVSAQREAYQVQAYDMIQTQGISPYDFPPEMTTAIGMEGMSALYSFFDRQAAGRQTETDFGALYNLQTLAAEQPDVFMGENLMDVRHLLSDSDFRALSTQQNSLRAERQGEASTPINLSEVFSLTDKAMELVGIRMPTASQAGSTSGQQSARRVAEMRAAMQREVEMFQQQQSRPPSQIETQQMIDRLLLPAIMTDERGRETEGKLFEFGGDIGAVGDASVSLDFEYDKIPLAARQTIEAELRAENQPVSNSVVEAVYAAHVASVSGLGIGDGTPEASSDSPEIGTPSAAMDAPVSAPRSEGMYADGLPAGMPAPSMDQPPAMDGAPVQNEPELAQIGQQVQSAIQSAGLTPEVNNLVANAVNRLQRDNLTRTERRGLYSELIAAIGQLPEGPERRNMRAELRRLRDQDQ